MSKTKKISSVRAIKNVTEGTVLIYKAVCTYENNFELSVERYKDDTLTEMSCANATFTDSAILEKLLHDMCKGELEPCHLKNIIEDME